MKKHTEKYVQTISRSKRPFKQYDEEGIKYRRDPFATKILKTSFWEIRISVSLKDFRWSKLYFSVYASELLGTRTVLFAWILVT